MITIGRYESSLAYIRTGGIIPLSLILKDSAPFGREVIWKFIGASVDRSNLGRCAIELRWLADTRSVA